MTTSGSVDFSVSRDNLIEDSLRQGGIIGVEDSASTGQKTWAARMLNMLVKSWHGYGIGLWARKTGWILPQTDTNEINLGPSGNHATLSYTQTTLSASAASSASTVSVVSATGIVSGYNIGIELDDGTMHWTTVNGVPSGTTITLTLAITGAATTGNYIWVYQTKLQRPIRVVEAYIRNEDTNSEIGMDVVARQEYEQMPNKETDGTPYLIAYEPLLDNGRAYIYPRISNGSQLIKLIFLRPFEDFDAANDTPDFPQEWYLAIMLNLAYLCSSAGGLPVQDRQALKGDAKEALAFALSNDSEEGSLLIYPNDIF